MNGIFIRGYKSIEGLQIDLSSLNVLIGQNGAGKSNFISVFKLLKNIAKGRLKTWSIKYEADNLLYYGSKVTDEILIGLFFDSFNYEVRLQAANDETLFISQEGIIPRAESASLITEYGLRESFLSEKSKFNAWAKPAYEYLINLGIYHFHDTSESAGVKKYAGINENRELFEDASNLAPFLYLLKQTQAEYYERIVKTVQLVIPYFNDFILRPDPLKNNEQIRLEWTDNYSDKTFTANELSDGSIRFICLAALLLQKDLPKTILLDEPELGLHPSAITILSGLLKKASKRSQLIVSTQSVSLVNEFEPEDIIVVERKKAGSKKEVGSTFKRLEAGKLESWLNEYSLGELWDKNIIGGNP
jgi:predicted ATPase